MSIISDNLKKARKAAGLTQERAAELLNEKRPSLGAWEEGRCKPPLTKFPKIVELYGITDLSGFVLNKDFDPKKQATGPRAAVAFIEQQSKKLKKIADELLKCY